MYVDDLIITDARTEDINGFKRKMVAHFRMSDLGALSYYIGIEVRQGRRNSRSVRAHMPRSCWSGAAWLSASHA